MVPTAKDWIARVKALGMPEKAFGVLLAIYLGVRAAAPFSGLTLLTQLILAILGTVVAVRLVRRFGRQAIWSLRNRLLVAYVFIAVVPLLLVAMLAGLGAYSLIRQVAVYLAMEDLDRRARILHDVSDTLANTDRSKRMELAGKMCETHRRRFPKLAIFLKQEDSVEVWPPSQETTPPEGWGEADGVAVRGTRYFLWSHARRGRMEVTVMMPLSRAYLSDMVPGLGEVALLDISDRGAPIRSAHEPPARPLPEAYNSFDVDLPSFSTVSVWQWDHPGKKQQALLSVRTRPSAVLNTVFNTRLDEFGDLFTFALKAVAVLFLIVELVALGVGISLSRTITRAVHNLYRGTQSVIEGDFSHRIQVHGRDQLAELGLSFNSMTENLERLLAVAKEKERLSAEIEIARQVQEQLYPKQLPALRTLRLAAMCQAARMVSGDYYDYLCLPDGQLALAIGDVAGKGISAALLMASIQSAMRMELRACHLVTPATSRLVGDLNQQLHATTSPEKYATFFFATYEEGSGMLHYTNAGHLPPLLFRRGVATPLEVSGTVVGAFAHAPYEDNHVQMEPGDLLLCYTDGITEPENEYGEEFGEARLIDLVIKNIDRDEGKIMSMILDAVEQWTKAGGRKVEQSDDMTLLLARKI
jgi:sigma-B regulation protein RsbU (phosphoserine phosphatase)